MFIAIVDLTEDNKISKYAIFETREEAEEHIAKYGWFVAETPQEGNVDTWKWDEIEEILINELPEPTSSEVNKERDRRINGGVIYDFAAATSGQIGQVEFQTDISSRENIAGAATLSFIAMSMGANTTNLEWANPGEIFTWTASDNTRIPMSAPLCLDFCTKAMKYKADLITAGRNIKDMTPTPQDYTNDSYWPNKVIND